MLFMYGFCCVSQRFPDKEAGQYPMAYVVRKHESNLTEKHVIDFISKQVYFYNHHKTTPSSLPCFYTVFTYKLFLGSNLIL